MEDHGGAFTSQEQDPLARGLAQPRTTGQRIRDEEPRSRPIAPERHRKVRRTPPAGLAGARKTTLPGMPQGLERERTTWAVAEEVEHDVGVDDAGAELVEPHDAAAIRSGQRGDLVEAAGERLLASKWPLEGHEQSHPVESAAPVLVEPQDRGRGYARPDGLASVSGGHPLSYCPFPR